MLARHFQERGHHVTVLTRGPYTAPWRTVHWDGINIGPWTEYLEGADVCINLAGRSVNCRYTVANRQADLRLAHRHNAPAGPGDCRARRSAAASGSTPLRPPSTASSTRRRRWPRMTGELGGNELTKRKPRPGRRGTSSSAWSATGRPRSSPRDAAHPQGGPAQRRRLQPHAGQRLCAFFRIWCG